MRIDTGVATLTLPGEPESGDLALVKRVERGVLVAAVDGLGHGEEAAAAAHAAVGAIDRYARESLPELIKRCHAALMGTRGVVVALAYLDPVTKTVTWLGVGNICGILLRSDGAARHKRVSLVPLAGFVGVEDLHPVERTVPLARGDTLILASDGIDSDFTDSVRLALDPQAMADDILARHATGRDDALVLVARYVGG